MSSNKIMAGIFDSITIVVPILFAIGLGSVMVYEKFKTNSTQEHNT